MIAVTAKLSFCLFPGSDSVLQLEDTHFKKSFFNVKILSLVSEIL